MRKGHGPDFYDCIFRHGHTCLSKRHAKFTFYYFVNEPPVNQWPSKEFDQVELRLHHSLNEFSLSRKTVSPIMG